MPFGPRCLEQGFIPTQRARFLSLWKIEYAPLFLSQPYPFSTTLRGLGVNIIGWGRCSRYVTWDLKVDGLQK